MFNLAQEWVPQRYPFLMVDYFQEIEPGKGAVGTKLVSIDEWFFQNNNHLVMPRPLMIEALAQTGVAAILSLSEFADSNVVFGGIESAHFYYDAIPGDVLVLKVEMTKLKPKMGLGMGRGEVYCNHELMCEATLIFAIVKEEGE